MIASARRQIESKVRPVTGTELLVVSTKEDAQGIIDVDSQIVFSEKDVDRWPQAVVSDMKVDSPSETVDRREKENQSLREEVTRLKRSALAAAERTCLLVLRIKDRECVVAQRERFISDREYERDTLWAEVEKEKIAAETKMQEAHAYGEVVHSTIEELKKRESMVKRSERDLEARDLAQAKLEGAFADKEAQMTEKMKALRQRLNDVTKLEKEAIEWKKKCERILVEHRKYVNGALDDLRKA
ncbi:hypothetical protein SARC_09669 [Sphaeroforma arctica JP610]|uniref:Uncharacterized protein n=1 Tax=Sphaeroforma arctica JP610 TaxID=667725 RepID=A0A0L0FPI0_9EUKA|nr:hypothetical protein SARC_09669 [Sphaeroforma arctica JP610]KNC77878.1 hypothetical protein SARC_09669 [Sphaeroforma arctica JP610]|eukprot:XP_014151780.1 hypothetical protein SARC_09669 [Sphaeroforma arctica JP610]